MVLVNRGIIVLVKHNKIHRDHIQLAMREFKTNAKLEDGFPKNLLEKFILFLQSDSHHECFEFKHRKMKSSFVLSYFSSMLISAFDPFDLVDYNGGCGAAFNTLDVIGGLLLHQRFLTISSGIIKIKSTTGGTLKFMGLCKGCLSNIQNKYFEQDPKKITESEIQITEILEIKSCSLNYLKRNCFSQLKSVPEDTDLIFGFKFEFEFEFD